MSELTEIRGHIISARRCHRADQLPVLGHQCQVRLHLGLQVVAERVLSGLNNLRQQRYDGRLMLDRIVQFERDQNASVLVQHFGLHVTIVLVEFLLHQSIDVAVHHLRTAGDLVAHGGRIAGQPAVSAHAFRIVDGETVVAQRQIGLATLASDELHAVGDGRQHRTIDDGDETVGAVALASQPRVGGVGDGGQTVLEVDNVAEEIGSGGWRQFDWGAVRLRGERAKGECILD